MKLGHWRSRPQQAEPAASQLVPALDRVREMREHSGWEPLTRPSTIQERADHVANVRKRVTIPPLAGERGGDYQKTHSIAPWLLDSLRPIFYGSSAMLALILSLYVFTPEHRPSAPPPPIEGTTIAFQLPEISSYAGLTEVQATLSAQRALRCVTARVGDWSLESKWQSDGEVYFRRTNNYEGTIIFRHSIYSSDIVRVRLKLDPDEKVIVCAVEPQ